MATSSKSSRRSAPIEAEVAAILAWLKRTGTKANRDGMARYAIPSDKTTRWVGKDVLRQLNSPAVARRLASRARQ